MTCDHPTITRADRKRARRLLTGFEPDRGSLCVCRETPRARNAIELHKWIHDLRDSSPELASKLRRPRRCVAAEVRRLEQYLTEPSRARQKKKAPPTAKTEERTYYEDRRLPFRFLPRFGRWPSVDWLPVLSALQLPRPHLCAEDLPDPVCSHNLPPAWHKTESMFIANDVSGLSSTSLSTDGRFASPSDCEFRARFGGW